MGDDFLIKILVGITILIWGIPSSWILETIYWCGENLDMRKVFNLLWIFFWFGLVSINPIFWNEIANSCSYNGWCKTHTGEVHLPILITYLFSSILFSIIGLNCPLNKNTDSL